MTLRKKVYSNHWHTPPAPWTGPWETRLRRSLFAPAAENSLRVPLLAGGRPDLLPARSRGSRSLPVPSVPPAPSGLAPLSTALPCPAPSPGRGSAGRGARGHRSSPLSASGGRSGRTHTSIPPPRPLRAAPELELGPGESRLQPPLSARLPQALTPARPRHD